MVVKCPTASPTDGSVLSVTATAHDKPLYERGSIPVCREAFDKPLDLAACTMVANVSDTHLLLRSWVQYHISLGVECIIVYVDEADNAFARSLLQDFLAAGQVRLVNFWFPRVSSIRNWRTQLAQDYHCLYWARGRARWMASMDIDEFFQLTSGNKTIPEALSYLERSEVAAVQTRSAFWTFNTSAGLLAAQRRRDFPCAVACRELYEPGKDGRPKIPHMLPDDYYFPQFIRAKLIINPENTIYFDVHRVAVGTKPVYKPSPTREMRLNHVQLRRSPADCVAGSGVEDLSFRDSEACRGLSTR